MPYIAILPDGKVSINLKSPADAAAATAELRSHKKELLIRKKEINETLRCIRAEYRDANLRRGSKIPGGGWLGRAIRLAQTAYRDTERRGLAEKTAPLEEQKRWIEGALISIEKAALIIERYSLSNP